MYILSQVLFILGAITILSTYFLKNRKLILAISIMACVIYSLANLFLGAYTGAGLNLVSILASVWFFIDSEKRHKKSIISLITVSVLTLAMTAVIIICGYENMISLLATVALMAFMYSIWQENLWVHKWLGIVTAVCWVIYQTYYNAFVGVITNVIFIIIDLVAIIRLYKDTRTKKENR